jgi:hypothetical protein
MSDATKPPGDPAGIRLARRNAQVLAEASTVARALEIILKRADCDVTVCSQLIREIVSLERTALQKSYGRIESRTRFKTATQRSILASGSRNILHIDESGQSTPEQVPSIKPTYFALAGIAMPQEQIHAYKAGADEIKLRFFNRSDITFHEPQMRDRRDLFRLRRNRVRQEEFDNAINELLEKTDFQVFGVGVRKYAFQEEFIDAGLDPYLPTDVYSLGITLLLERYIDFLHSESPQRLGTVIFESQGTLEDAIHQLEYARTLVHGSQWVAGKSFQLWLEPGLTFCPKCGSDPMEIADMFARDLFEWTRSECTGTPKRWEIFSRKIYHRGDGKMGKFGVKIFPDSDIRERIDAHRLACGAVP